MSESRRRKQQLLKLSRFLSLLLRHRPSRFPLQMDARGFADLGEVMHMIQALPNFRWATRADVDTVLELPGKQRFEIVGSETGPRIRALYGHTALRLEYEPVKPPDALYHGTAPDVLDAILREGIQPMERQYVHLASNPETARNIALRHTGEPVILRIDARAAYVQGQSFYHPTEDIYLTDAVLPNFVTKV